MGKRWWQTVSRIGGDFIFYETVLGDTWDMIAEKVYQDATKADILIENNPFLVAVAIFNAGTYVYIPELPIEEDETYPDWRN